MTRPGRHGDLVACAASPISSARPRDHVGSVATSSVSVTTMFSGGIQDLLNRIMPAGVKFRRWRLIASWLMPRNAAASMPCEGCVDHHITPVIVVGAAKAVAEEPALAKGGLDALPDRVFASTERGTSHRIRSGRVSNGLGPPGNDVRAEDGVPAVSADHESPSAVLPSAKCATTGRLARSSMPTRRFPK